MDKNNDPKKNPQGSEKKPRGIGTALLITIVIVIAISFIYNMVSSSQYKKVTYSQFLEDKDNGNIVEIDIYADRVEYFTKEEMAKHSSARKAHYTGLPYGNAMELANELDAMGVKVTSPIIEDNSGIIMILFYAGMILMTFMLIRSVSKRMSGDGMLGGLGGNKAKM